MQCKQWKRQQAGVSIVREIHGLLAHSKAYAIKIVCIGLYKKDAGPFAHGKPIVPVSSTQPLEMIRTLQSPEASSDTTVMRVELSSAQRLSAAPAARGCQHY
ncbi:restriction endonuclease [Xanthomonas arboricola]|uniref:restriction endonuclease n=1 Tax=Xanthomonas arboricola TaxID=56448 RepID=UPI002158752D|nr:restriction endonuclease [Xanthomonas arboricola]